LKDLIQVIDNLQTIHQDQIILTIKVILILRVAWDLMNMEWAIILANHSNNNLLVAILQWVILECNNKCHINHLLVNNLLILIEK